MVSRKKLKSDGMVVHGEVKELFLYLLKSYWSDGYQTVFGELFLHLLDSYWSDGYQTIIG